MATDTIGGPHKIETVLEKTREGESAPYAIERTATWHEADGSQIVSDPARIAELEARVAAQTEDS